MKQGIFERSVESGPLYAPTPFWAAAVEQLSRDLTPERLMRFRSLPGPLGFFVPTYGYPANGLSAAQMAAIETLAQSASIKQAQRLRSWTRGHSLAEADYRVFAAMAHSVAPGLMKFSESGVGAPSEQFIFNDRSYSRSALNYLLGLCFLAQFTDIRSIRSILEIGGGFGVLGEILAQVSAGDGIRYIDLDIPPTCGFAEYYLSSACPGRSFSGTDVGLDEIRPLEIKHLKEINVLPNWCIEQICGNIDLFVNYISFQEMEPPVVRNYLEHVDRLAPRWILLRNLREGKQKRAADNLVGVEVPVLSDFYRENLSNYRCVGSDAEVCGHTTIDGFHSELLIFERHD